MRGKIKTARTKASKLHGAQATYVSLVDAGANETPFTLIKSKTGAKAMTIKKRGGNKAKSAKSHKPLSSAKKGDDAAVETRTENSIAKMVFSAEVFEDEAAVRDYIEKAEWEADDIEIVQNDDGNFEARSDGLSDDDFDKIAKVETDEDGVEAFVGQRTVEVKTDDAAEDTDEDDDADTETKSEDDAADDDAEEDGEDDPDNAGTDDLDVTENASGDSVFLSEDGEKGSKLSKRAAFLKRRKEAKAAQKVAKFDQWDAHFSKGNTLAKTLADGMDWDGTPPGFYDVQAAFNSAVGNIVADEGMADGKQEALNKAAAEYAEIIGGLDTFFDAYVSADEETVAKAYTDEAEREAVAKWADGFGDFVAGEEAAPKTVAKEVVAKSDEAPAIDYKKIGGTVADLIAKAVAPLTEQIGDVTETVEALATRAPTKKAASTEDGGTAKPRKLAKQKADDTSKEDAEAESFAKSFLG